MTANKLTAILAACRKCDSASTLLLMIYLLFCIIFLSLKIVFFLSSGDNFAIEKFPKAIGKPR